MATSRRTVRGWLRGNGKNRVTLITNSALFSSHTDRSIGTCLGVEVSGHIDGPPPGHLWPIIYASGRTLYRGVRQAPTCARIKYICMFPVARCIKIQYQTSYAGAHMGAHGLLRMPPVSRQISGPIDGCPHGRLWSIMYASGCMLRWSHTSVTALEIEYSAPSSWRHI